MGVADSAKKPLAAPSRGDDDERRTAHDLGLAVTGRLGRRAFMGRAAANTTLAGAVRAAGPERGGTLTLGLQGGESTNSLDPAPAASQAPCSILFDHWRAAGRGEPRQQPRDAIGGTGRGDAGREDRDVPYPQGHHL
jgi:hypothetical protein